MALLRVRVRGLMMDERSKSPIVILQEEDGERILPIWIGEAEARAIGVTIAGEKLERPMSHDLMKSILDTFKLQLDRIVVHDIVEGTFYAKLILKDGGGEQVEVDARPSDAIALSLRTQTPIFVPDHILEEAAITGKEPDDEEIQKFKEFISSVKPSDFKD